MAFVLLVAEPSTSQSWVRPDRAKDEYDADKEKKVSPVDRIKSIIVVVLKTLRCQMGRLNGLTNTFKMDKPYLKT